MSKVSDVEAIELELRDLYVNYQVKVHTLYLGTQLMLCMQYGEKMLCERTPPSLDYHAMDWREWLYRTAVDLSQELLK